MSTSENGTNAHNGIPKAIIITEPEEEDVKVLHEYQNKKANFFIGDADTRPTKVWLGF